jgi:hypothetical protein
MDRRSPWFPWEESAIHQPEVRFDIRAERAEYERWFRHHARILQDRMVRRSRTDRTRKHDVPEWERVYQAEAQQRRLLYQARVLGSSATMRFEVETMHPIVEEIRKRFLLDLEHSAAQLREQFPSLTFNVWEWPTGRVAEYIDYDIGVECLFPTTAENAPDNVALMIEVCFLNSTPRFNAGVGWGHPSIHSEAEFRDNCLKNAEWPEAKPETIDELRDFFPTLVRAFESAVERGVPSDLAGDATH